MGVTTQLYVASVSAIGLAVIAWALPIVAGPERVPLAVLVCLSIPVSLVKVRLPRVAATLTLSHVLNYVALLTLGTHAARSGGMRPLLPIAFVSCTIIKNTTVMARLTPTP